MRTTVIPPGYKLYNIGVDSDGDYFTLNCPGHEEMRFHITHADLVSLMSDIIESRLVRLNPVLS